MATARRLLALLAGTVLAETGAETATARVRLRVASDEVDKDKDRAPDLLPATTVVRVRVSVRVREAQEASRGATIAVRPGLFRLARATVETGLRETASATTARAQAESGARASGVAPTASVLGAATEASVLLEVATEASVRPRVQVARRPARETAVRVLRKTRPIAVPSVKVATARRGRPTSAPRTIAIAMASTIAIAGRARALRTRAKPRRRVTYRASPRCSHGRKSGES